MKKKFDVINIFRWCGFVILALVSLFFIYNLSISLAIDPIEKFAIVAGAIGLEFFKLFSIISATTYSYLGKQLGIKIKKRWFLYFTYIWVSMYSVLASFGYSVTAVDKMQTSITVLNHESTIALEQENIKNYNETITDYKNTKTGYESSKIAYINELQGADATARDTITKKISTIDNSIAAVQAKISIAIDKKTTSQNNIDTLKREDLSASTTTKRTMYDVIHDTIKIPAKTVAFIVLLVFSTSVELGIFATAPHANKIDNLIAGSEAVISNYKKRKPQKKQEAKGPVDEETDGADEDGKEEDGQEKENDNSKIYSGGVSISKTAEQNTGLVETQTILPTKIESRAEEILHTLDEDRPTITDRVKRLVNRI